MSNKNSLGEEYKEVFGSDEYTTIKKLHTEKLKGYIAGVDSLTDKYIAVLDKNLDILKSRWKISDFTLAAEKAKIKSKRKVIHELDKILQNEKYKIAFIGSVGVGKTTAISHSQDLTYTVDRKNRNGKIVKGKSLKEILAVNTGNTTICEVRLNFIDDHSSIEVVPFTEQDFMLELDGTVEKLRSGENTVTIEISRAIKNMAHYNKWEEKEKENFKDLDQNHATEFFLKKINLENRIEEKIYYKSNISEKEWLAEEFRKINYGENDKFSLPQLITLNINKNIVKNINTDYQIVDTKGFGMENIESREDILSYIKEKNTICILCSNYAEAPTNINLELLKFAKNRSKFNIHKMGVLVIDRENSQNTKNSSGMDMDDREEALNIKREHIISNFQRENLHTINIPIEFYDIKNIEDDGILNSFLDKTIENYKNNILKLAEMKRLELWEYCYHLPFEIEKRRENRKVIRDKYIQELKYVKKNFSPNKFQNPFNEYRKILFSIHHMKIMALNRRYGNYDGLSNQASIDFAVLDFIEKEFKVIKDNFFKNFSEEIISIQDQDLKKILQTLEDNFDDQLTIAVSDVYEGFHSDYLADDFYIEVQDFWGRGEGYLRRVSNSYEKKLEFIFENLID